MVTSSIQTKQQTITSIHLLLQQLPPLQWTRLHGCGPELVPVPHTLDRTARGLRERGARWGKQVDPGFTQLTLHVLSTLETKLCEAAFKRCFQLQPAPLQPGKPLLVSLLVYLNESWYGLTFH